LASCFVFSASHSAGLIHPRVISKFSDVRTIAILDVVAPESWPDSRTCTGSLAMMTDKLLSYQRHKVFLEQFNLFFTFGMLLPLSV
jgi:hypothetical protein